MQRSHRNAHRWVWPLLALVAVAVLVLSVQARPEYPERPVAQEGR